MSTIRDTHFQGFARLLQHELNAAYHVKVMQLQGGISIDADAWEREVQQTIARRAFDLAEHVYNHTTEAMTAFSDFAVIAEENDIPDLTVLPAPQADAPEPAADQPPATSPRTD